MTPLLTTASTVICPHGGMATLTTSNSKAIVAGAPVLLLTDMHMIAGCTFSPGAPSPCLTIRWITAATQVNVDNVPVLLQNSVGLCMNAFQAPQGTAIVVQTQTQAMGV